MDLVSTSQKKQDCNFKEHTKKRWYSNISYVIFISIYRSASYLLLKCKSQTNISYQKTFNGVTHSKGKVGIWGGEVATFFINLQFTHIYCVCGKSEVSFWIFLVPSLLSYPFKILIQVFIYRTNTWYHFDICTFLIHSGSLQKILTALFNSVRNTQES